MGRVPHAVARVFFIPRSRYLYSQKQRSNSSRIRINLWCCTALKHPRQTDNAPRMDRSGCGQVPSGMGSQCIQPVDDLAVAAAPLNQTIEPIAAITLALFTAHAKQLELADEIAEDDCAVAGHGDHDRIENLASIKKRGAQRFRQTRPR